MNTTDHLLVNIKDGIATLTLNRPERLNALSRQMIDTAITTLELLADDPAIGCIVITGSDRGFCAGGDVTAMDAGHSSDLSFEQRVNRQQHGHRLSGLLYSMPKITIAAVNGAAAGAGLGIALACDLRIASDKAKFTTAFAKVGFSGDFGVTWPLVRMLGDAKAKELLYLSDVLSADQALALGLVNRVVPHEQFGEVVHEISTRIASGPQTAYRYMKENVRMASQQDYQSILDREAWTQLRTGDTDDHREGARAFVEKRLPRFTGK
jgi:2-(1,2-epoxy-1,2-dihydrophenyl)acetyl-CoA isomerase